MVKPGLFTTVQDAGRVGYRGYGVPVGGWFDGRSAALANALVGNEEGAAVLELTLQGGVYEAETDLGVALAGAPMQAWVERHERGGRQVISIPQSLTIRAGDRLEIGATEVGARTYLAVVGGWLSEVVLGSRSSEARLEAGTLVGSVGGVVLPRRRPCVRFEIAGGAEACLRVTCGPEFNRVVKPEWERGTYRVGSKSNRMGVRLEGTEVDVEVDANRVSAPVVPGAMQVAGGQLIVLGVSCGTMGGYPHVATVIAADLPLVGQLRPGQTVRLARVGVEEAREIDRRERKAREKLLLQVRVLARDVVQ